MTSLNTLTNRKLKSSYHVDLVALMRTYETNYLKLNRLIPRGAEVGEKYKFQVLESIYQLEVRELTKYTTLVSIIQCDTEITFPLSNADIRLYRDAKMAEVCASEQFLRVKPIYDYPNSKMRQKDEKHQLNQFLGEWLTFCLKYGLAHLDEFSS